ncbi:MAG: AAA family ATPase [Candidatus Kapabacteria bacterium]|nr:AAA family ATPase [Candidatus Kapabacteria bacterium]
MITEHELRSIITSGETLDVEFKGESRAQLNDNDIVEAIVCLVNGGAQKTRYLVIGVEDDGTITGARKRHGSVTDASKLQGMIAARTRPELSTNVHVVYIDDVEVIVIKVYGVGHLTGTSHGKFMRRTMGGDGKPMCVPMDVSAINSFNVNFGGLDASASVVQGVVWNDLDPVEFARYRQFIESGRGDQSLLELDDLELALALGAASRQDGVVHVHATGLLVFGKASALRTFIPNHEVAFQVFSGTDLVVNQISNHPILRALEETERMFAARNTESEIFVGMQRIGIPNFSSRSFREVVANAIVHRDYLLRGAVNIQLVDDMLTVSNPGGFPDGVHQGNILVTPPRPRNPRLADVLKRAGIVDRTARGIDTIYLEQLRNGRPAPSYEQSDQHSVVVKIPGGNVRVGFVTYLTERQNSGRPLTLDDLLVLNQLFELRKADTKSLATSIQKAERETLSVLHRLVEQGVVEDRGARRGRLWLLSADVYDRLGDRTGYVRQRGFDVLQQRAMVEQYLKTHGKITRAETAELCKISLPQAYRLLKALVNKGLAVSVGSRGRGTHYEYIHR